MRHHLPPRRLMRACENAIVFMDLREGVGSGGGYHHSLLGFSKWIAFHFAPPPPIYAAKTHCKAALYLNLYPAKWLSARASHQVDMRRGRFILFVQQRFEVKRNLTRMYIYPGKQ